MPKIDVVDVMRKAPGRCLVCSTTPMEDGKPKRAIDLNTDVDWGDNAYLCDECVDVICDLWGRVDEQTYSELKSKHEELKLRHRTLRRRFKELEARIKTIVKGR